MRTEMCSHCQKYKDAHNAVCSDMNNEADNEALRDVSQLGRSVSNRLLDKKMKKGNDTRWQYESEVLDDRLLAVHHLLAPAILIKYGKGRRFEDLVIDKESNSSAEKAYATLTDPVFLFYATLLQLEYRLVYKNAFQAVRGRESSFHTAPEMAGPEGLPVQWQRMFRSAVMDESELPPEPESGAFAASNVFVGARPGYSFTLGCQGLGYYRDTTSTSFPACFGSTKQDLRFPGFILAHDAVYTGSNFASELAKQKTPAYVRKESFVPSDSWAGFRSGFVFKTGPFGLGYYEDCFRATANVSSPPAFTARGRKERADASEETFCLNPKFCRPLIDLLCKHPKLGGRNGHHAQRAVKDLLEQADWVAVYFGEKATAKKGTNWQGLQRLPHALCLERREAGPLEQREVEEMQRCNKLWHAHSMYASFPAPEALLAASSGLKQFETMRKVELEELKGDLAWLLFAKEDRLGEKNPTHAATVAFAAGNATPTPSPAYTHHTNTYALLSSPLPSVMATAPDPRTATLCHPEASIDSCGSILCRQSECPH